MSTVIIYALCDPENHYIRYVGQSKEVHARYNNHLICNHRKNEKQKWIFGLVSKGLKPTLVILEVCTPEVAQLRERFYISLFSATLYQKDAFVHKEHNDLKKSLLLSGQSVLSVAGALGVSVQFLSKVVNDKPVNPAIAERVKNFIFGCEPMSG